MRIDPDDCCRAAAPGIVSHSAGAGVSEEVAVRRRHEIGYSDPMAIPPLTPTRVKICGLSTEVTLAAALEVGADWIGLVHFPPSPRHVDLARAGALSRLARGKAERVVLLVDPEDALILAVLEAADPDMIQLHGRESPQRVAEIR